MLQSNYFFKRKIFQLSVQFGFVVFECQLGLQRKVPELSGLQKIYLYSRVVFMIMLFVSKSTCFTQYLLLL